MKPDPMLADHVLACANRAEAAAVLVGQLAEQLEAATEPAAVLMLALLQQAAVNQLGASKLAFENAAAAYVRNDVPARRRKS